MIEHVIIFIVSAVVLTWISSSLIKTLVKIAKYLGWREFIVAFFVMAFAASLPNLFIDLNAVLQGIPELAFGDIIGGNLVDLTLAMAIVVLFSKKNTISTQSNMIQGSAVFTFLIGILPILLLWNGRVTRIDGAILLLAFAVYSFWIFSKDDRFKKVYKQTKKEISDPKKRFIDFIINIFKLVVFVALLLIASQGIIKSAEYFSTSLGISLSLVGILIVALGNCFPEIYFGIISARRGEGWMVLGDMMGSVIICATLVLGLIALISPFEIKDMAIFFTVRAFTIISALIFLLIIRTDKKVTKKEALLLLLVYISFLITSIFVK
jgi:cation:H+ antiporter